MRTAAQKRKYGIFFVISFIALIASLFIAPEWCWVVFPFLGTSAVLGLDMI